MSTFVTVSITRGSNNIFPWRMMQIQLDWTFAKLFEMAIDLAELPENFERTGQLQPTCFLSRDIKGILSESVLVALDFNAVECCRINGSFVRYQCPCRPKPATGTLTRSAVEVLMNASKEVRWPEKNFSSSEEYQTGNGDKCLYDDIIDFLQDKKLGFTCGCEHTSGKQVIKTLQNVLFSIQPHLSTLKARNSGFVPSFFSPLMTKVYNDPTKHHHKPSPLSQERLDKLSSLLYTALSTPWIQSSRWKEFANAISLLASNIDEYRSYLKCKAEEQGCRHRSLTPLRSPADGASSHIQSIVRARASVRAESLIKRYKKLEEALSSLLPYSEPVFLNDFAPTHPHSRYSYIHELALPFSIECYSYAHGNNLGTLWYLWRVPENKNDQDLNQTKALIQKIESGIDVYHTREMRRQFTLRYGLVCEAKQAVLTDMYQFLTGDKSISSISKDVLERLHFVLDSQDPDVAFDLRVQNPGRPEAYHQFWQGVNELMHEHSLKAVDDRRHGLICHMALAFSVNDLCNQVIAKYPGIEVPSVEWVRCQFWPSNPFRLSASRYTGRFLIKFMVQSRQVSANHPDSHYCGAIFKYLREFAIKFKSHVTFASQDDKHFIKLGEPGFPVAAVERGKQVLVSQDIPFLVGDHDFTKAKLIPSVSLLCNVPDSITESFYSGKVLVMLKDGIFEPSSALRHCTELLHALEFTNSHLNPILCLYTDGGPDHRTNFLSVQVALIGLFRILDLDMLVAARTAPYNSYRNPVERIMSLLNIGLQSVGLMREKMVDEMEKAMSQANNMEEIRKVAQGIPDFRKHFSQSLKPACQLLSDILTRLQLKGESVVIQESCTEESVDTLFSKVVEIEPGLKKTDTQQRDLKRLPKLTEFIEHCCRRRKYFFCIKKCGNASCHMCKPPIMCEEFFCELHHFPDPLRKPDSESYKEFQDVWGQPTSEEDMPSLKTRKSQSQASFRLSGEKVRDVVTCGECLKPRCVYSAKSLTNKQLILLREYSYDHFYVCGGSIVPEESELASLCVFETGINCESELSSHYFSSRLKFPLRCYVCGVFSDLVWIPPEKSRQFQSIHPICTYCQQAGKKERTRGPRFAGQKRGGLHSQ